MTRDEAKAELRKIKHLEKSISSVESELECLMTVATKMTPSYDVVNVSGGHKDKIADTLVKIEEYREKLATLVIEQLDFKNQCLDKVEKMEPNTLRSILFYYYFMDNTLEKTAELIGKSYQWTYVMFTEAIDKYCEISNKLSST